MTTCSLLLHSFSNVKVRIRIFVYSTTLDVDSWDSSRLWPSLEHFSYWVSLLNVKLVVPNCLVSGQPKSGNHREMMFFVLNGV